MEKELKDKVSIAIHETLQTMIRSMVSAGLPPLEAIELVEIRLAEIRTTVENAVERSQGNEAVADVSVRGVGGKRTTAEKRMETLRAQDPEGGQLPDVRGERRGEPPSGNPRRSTGTDNQAGYSDNDPF